MDYIKFLTLQEVVNTEVVLDTMVKHSHQVIIVIQPMVVVMVEVTRPV